MKVYTKTGDKGLTGLLGGSRVAKADARIALYGEVDELNSHIGLTRAHTGEGFSQDKLLKHVQSRLFDLGSQMACEPEQRTKFKLPDIEPEHITELEKAIDVMTEDLPQLKNFVLPAGGVAAASAHVARTVCRRVERSFVAFHNEHPNDLKDIHLQFLNRLSDYLFILARTLVHHAGQKEEIWKA
tara:strand:- start:4199 stop:4753 length:555 start_codon:yes stop_codon:yes gene_type:complete